MQRRWWWWQAPPALAVAVVCHLVFALVLGLRSVGYLERLELIAYDQAVQRRADTTAREPRIAIIGLTEKDFSQYPWPLDDETLAALIERLIGLGARAVAVDLYRDHPIPPGSERLTALLTGTANVIWGYRFADAHAPGTPPPAVRSADQTGFADQVVDRDGVVRRMLLYLEQDDTVGVSLALRMAEQFLKPLGIWPKPDPRNPDLMQLGAATYVPLDANSGGYHHIDARGYQVLLDYALGPDPFEQYSLRTVLEEPWPPDAFAERLVFIGLATDTVKDFFNTPFTSDYESVTFGVALHALETNQLLRNALDRTPLTTPLSDVSGTLWIWGWCLLGGLWGYVTTSTPRFAVGTVSGAGLLTALWYAALVNYLWIPLMPAVLGWIASATLLLAYMRRREQEERQTIMRLFSCYVSKEVAHEIWQQRNVLLARGSPQPRRLIATVLVTDIEDFTSLAESLDAHEVMKWMNVYLNAMIESVVTHGGAVIRFTNDGVVAAFGVPLFRQSEAEIDSDAGNAVDCALEISQKLMHLNTTSRVRGRPPVNLRVGIYTGPLVVGSRGSPERMEYAVIGDTVNVAERLEAFSKELPKLTGADSPCRIAVGDATWLRLRKRYLGISVGKVSLKGKEKKIEVFQVVDAGHGSIEHPPLLGEMS